MPPPLKEHVEYHKDGSVWARGQTADGVPTGYWEWFRKDGTRMRSGYFEEGKQVGEWTTYDEAGAVYKVTRMKAKQVGEAHIRHERPGDEAAITEITQLAFRGHPHSDNREHLVVLALRSAGALSISLVAEDEGEVVGHVAFSPVTISDGSSGWYGLGPVSVLPQLQGHGLGTALVWKGLDTLRAMGAKGCVVLGEPAYYGRFGFEHRADCSLPGVPAGYFQSLAFKGSGAKGDVTYHAAFDEASATRP